MTMSMAMEDTCDHRWNSDKPVRLCKVCGQIRTFPSGTEAPRIIWGGPKDKRSPKELSSEDKKTIAEIAHSFGPAGPAKIAKITDIAQMLLNIWVTRYIYRDDPARRKAKEAMPPAPGEPIPEIPYNEMNRHQQHDYLEAHREEITKDLQTIGVPGVLEKWPFGAPAVSRLISKWGIENVLYARDLKGEVESGKAASDNGLPPFPTFNESWAPTVQVAWLESYSRIKFHRDTGR
jgi:hypothetical protein